MRISRADVKTTNAAGYMKQLCRHWGHRSPVAFDEEEGKIELPQATCRLKVSPDVLAVELALSDDADQARLEAVVAEHLQRFGFREELVFDWVRGEG